MPAVVRSADVAGQRRVVGRDDETACLGDDPPAHERHHERRRERAAARAPAAINSGRRGRASAGCRRPARAAKRLAAVRRAVEPQHLVGEPLDEIATGRVGDEPSEARPDGGAPPAWSWPRRLRSSSSASSIARSTRAPSSTSDGSYPSAQARPSATGPAVARSDTRVEQSGTRIARRGWTSCGPSTSNACRRRASAGTIGRTAAAITSTLAR